MKRGEFMNDVMRQFYNYSNPYNQYFTNSQWNNYLDNENAVHGLSNCFCKKSFLRVLNTYDDTLDVQINDIIMAENLKAGDFTRYVKFEPGTYHMKIYVSEPKKLVFESTIDIDQNLAYTGAISQDDADKTDISVLIIPEAREYANKGKMTGIRLINLAADTPDLELAVTDGAVIFSGINYGDVSNNVAVPSGLYKLSLREKESKKEVKTMNIDFAPSMHYTLFVAGEYDNNDIKIIIPEDGVNYLELC
jgi:hypothetical protein